MALLLAAISFSLPSAALAVSASPTSIHVLYASVRPGDPQTISVAAYDLEGAPLTGASTVVTVHYPTVNHTYHLTHTNSAGMASVTFHVPPGIRASRATVDAVVSNGYLDIPLTTSFAVGGAAAPASLVVLARALPATVSASQPVWVAVYAHTRSGVDAAGAKVAGTAYFKEGVRHVSGTMDKTGVATLRVDTKGIQANETVRVTATVTWKTMKGSVSTTFTVRKPTSPAAAPATPSVSPTPAPTLTSQPLPTPTPLPTWTSVPTTTSPPPGETAPTSTSTPTSTPTPGIITVQPGAAPTATATPPDTPTTLPTPTATAVPTATPTATSTPTSTPTPAPTPTPTLVPNCPGSQSACMQAVLDMLNETRGSAGLQPLMLNMTQSNGTASCDGSIGNSKEMAQIGTIGHYQFPGDICVPITGAAENVGTFHSGNELQDLRGIHSLFMSEQHDSAYCVSISYDNHACNILDRHYSQVGIGIVYQNGSTWLTEDFLG